jgi:DeoR family suf operon transcriptional repressor
MELQARSTKDEIISLLKDKQQLTVTDLAKELCVTEMAVRRHISKLEKEELIEATLMRQHVGRPAYVYQLSAKGEDLFPKQYKEFTLGLLEDLKRMGQEPLIHELMATHTERAKAKIEKRLTDKKSLGARLKEIAAVQEQNGYMTDVKQQADGTFIFTQQNCPLLSVAKQVPYLCEREGAMYQELLPEAEVTILSCIADHDCTCMYKIQKKR